MKHNGKVEPLYNRDRSSPTFLKIGMTIVFKVRPQMFCTVLICAMCTVLFCACSVFPSPGCMYYVHAVEIEALFTLTSELTGLYNRTIAEFQLPYQLMILLLLLSIFGRCWSQN